MSTRIWIVARTALDALACAERNHLIPGGWHYVSCADKLAGLYGVTVWFYGDWWNHPRAREIAEMVKLRNLGSMTAPVDVPAVTKIPQHLRNPRKY